VTSSHGADAGQRRSCSAVARTLGEPLAGTATAVRVWVAVEHPGPYPRKAVPDALAPALAEWVGRAGKHIRLQLIRRPRLRGGETSDATTDATSQVFVAHAAAAPVWLAAGRIDDVAEISGWDPVGLLDGGVPEGMRPEHAPVYLVCANGRRDACCAAYGRDAAADLLRRHPGRVWETSHLGGHRFAPVIARLPDGFMFGGPLATTESTASSRGRSALSPRAQVAELAVLRASDDRVPRALRVSDEGDRLLVTDGPAQWSVEVAQRLLGERRPESCNAEEGPVTTITAVAVHRVVGQDVVTPTTEPA